jgi:hypothetical protein
VLRHVTVTAPAAGAPELAALLRRAATALEGLGDVVVHDLSLRTEPAAEGGSATALTLYYRSRGATTSDGAPS